MAVVRIDRGRLASLLPLSILPFDVERVLRDVAIFYDDFLGYDILMPPWYRTYTVNGWSGIGGEAHIGDRARGGVMRCWTGALVNGSCRMSLQEYRQFNVSLNPVMECRIGLTVLTQETVWFGLYRDASDNILFVYDPTTEPANWFTQTVAGGAAQSMDAGVPADTEFHVFTIRATPTLVQFLIDGEVRTEHDLNITAANFEPTIYIFTKEDADKEVQIDYVVVVQRR